MNGIKSERIRLVLVWSGGSAGFRQDNLNCSFTVCAWCRRSCNAHGGGDSFCPAQSHTNTYLLTTLNTILRLVLVDCSYTFVPKRWVLKRWWWYKKSNESLISPIKLILYVFLWDIRDEQLCSNSITVIGNSYLSGDGSNYLKLNNTSIIFWFVHSMLSC